MVVADYKKITGVRPLYLKNYVIQTMAERHSETQQVRGIEKTVVFDFPKEFFREQRIKTLDPKYVRYMFN